MTNRRRRRRRAEQRRPRNVNMVAFMQGRRLSLPPSLSPSLYSSPSSIALRVFVLKKKKCSTVQSLGQGSEKRCRAKFIKKKKLYIKFPEKKKNRNVLGLCLCPPSHVSSLTYSLLLLLHLFFPPLPPFFLYPSPSPFWPPRVIDSLTRPRVDRLPLRRRPWPPRPGQGAAPRSRTASRPARTPPLPPPPRSPTRGSCPAPAPPPPRRTTTRSAGSARDR